MKNESPQALNQDKFMLEDPVAYNTAVVNFFREKYSPFINQVFEDLQKKAASPSSPWLAEAFPTFPMEVLERYLFPAFAAGSHSGGITEPHLAFCKAYIEAIALPVLRVDRLIDRPSFLLERTENKNSYLLKVFLSELCLLHEGLSEMCKLPNAKQVIRTTITDYLQVFASLYHELLDRYNPKAISEPEEYLRHIFCSAHSQLTCRYFSTMVQGSILLNSKEVDQKVKELVYRFGRLRQLCDQICDVEEDIAMGKVTIPVLYALVKDRGRLSSAVHALWTEIENSKEPTVSPITASRIAEVKHLVQDLGGFDRAYRLADKWYRQAVELFHTCSNQPGIGVEVLLLFRLKRAFLERLKQYNWSDISDYY